AAVTGPARLMAPATGPIYGARGCWQDNTGATRVKTGKRNTVKVLLLWFGRASEDSLEADGVTPFAPFDWRWIRRSRSASRRRLFLRRGFPRATGWLRHGPFAVTRPRGCRSWRSH